MLPDRVSNQGPLTYESGVLWIVLRGPASLVGEDTVCIEIVLRNLMNSLCFV